MEITNIIMNIAIIPLILVSCILVYEFALELRSTRKKRDSK